MGLTSSLGQQQLLFIPGGTTCFYLETELFCHKAWPTHVHWSHRENMSTVHLLPFNRWDRREDEALGEEKLSGATSLRAGKCWRQTPNLYLHEHRQLPYQSQQIGRGIELSPVRLGHHWGNNIAPELPVHESACLRAPWSPRTSLLSALGLQSVGHTLGPQETFAEWKKMALRLSSIIAFGESKNLTKFWFPIRNYSYTQIIVFLGGNEYEL